MERTITSKGILIAAGLLLVTLLVSAGLAFAKPPDGSTKNRIDALEAQVSALEAQVEALMTFVQAVEPFITVNPDPMDGLAGPHIIFEGANVHVRSGSGATDDDGILLGLGNLVVGYNEDAELEGEDRTGSHNLVVGQEHTYSSYGGFIAGHDNTISGALSSVSGGYNNTASGARSSVSGGTKNEASGFNASVSGGVENGAIGFYSSVSGGSNNIASGARSSVSGGVHNEASGFSASVSGGTYNTAAGQYSSVSGGANRNAPTADSWAAGSLLQPN